MTIPYQRITGVVGRSRGCLALEAGPPHLRSGGGTEPRSLRRGVHRQGLADFMGEGR